MTSFVQTLSTPAGRTFVLTMVFVFLAGVVTPGNLHAQATKVDAPQKEGNAALGADYRVGPGDHIYLSVPQRPDLNRQLAVSAGGAVNLPLVGSVAVAGLNKAEIEAKLLQSLREYYPSVNRVEVNITQALSNVIFVSGEVRFPGKYTFPENVNAWEAIREAGGAMPNANLSSVRLVQDRARGGNSELVDIQTAIENGTVESLPVLRPGDTIIIPGAEEAYSGSAGVNVAGQVTRPGNYRLTGRQDLMGAILLAGGPTEVADMSDIVLIRPDGDGRAQKYKINVKDFLEDGKMESNPKLKAGDTVTVGKRTFTGRNLGLVLGFVTTVATLVLLYYTIQNEASTSD